MNENLPPELASMTLWQFLYMLVAAACGATISVLLRLLDGEKLSRLEVFSTYFIGICVAMFFSNMIGVVFNIPSGVSMTIGGTSMMSGMLGITGIRRFVKMLRKMGEKS